MFWLRIFADLINIFKAGASPTQMGAGFALGFMIGLTPGWPIHVIVLVLLVLILNVNLSMVIFASFIAAGIGWLVDPQLDLLGAYILQEPSLNAFWTTLYNTPFASLTHFNNTVIMGAFVAGLALILPLFFLVYLIVKKFGQPIGRWIKKTRLGKLVLGSKIYSVYSRVRRVKVI